MSTYEESLVAARFAALAPEPLAGNWDDVLDRAGARKDRGRLGHSRVGQGRRRRLFVVIAVVAFVAVVSASALAVRAFVLDKGFSGLPPVGATPSTPERGVLEMYYWVHDVRGRTRNWVYADGRLIRRGVTRDNGTPLPASASNASRSRESSSCDPRSCRQEGSDTPSRRPAASPSITPIRRRSRYAGVTGSSPSHGRAI